MKYSDLLQRLKRRSPTIKGLLKIWRPTNCLMCYWTRMAVVFLIAVSLPNFFAISISTLMFLIAGYYGIRPHGNEAIND